MTMPSGNVSLLEAAKYGSDQKARGMIETIIFESPVVEMLPWVPFEGVALAREVEATLPTVSFRNVNEGYSKSWGSDTAKYWGVAIMGGEIGVDNFLVNVVGNLQSQKAKQAAKLAKANAARFNWEFFFGTGAASTKGFAGLRSLIAEGHGQQLLNATGGGSLDLDKLDEAFDLFRNQGSADAILASYFFRRRLTQKARTSVTGVSLIDVGTDVFGRKVTMYNDTPIRIIGDMQKSDGTIQSGFLFDEDPGDGTADTQSAYLVKFGEDDVCGLLGKGGSLTVKDFGETEAAPAHLLRMEWYPGVAVHNTYSVVRLYGITNA